MSDGVLAMWDAIYPGLSRAEQEKRSRVVDAITTAIARAGHAAAGCTDPTAEPEALISSR